MQHILFIVVSFHQHLKGISFNNFSSPEQNVLSVNFCDAIRRASCVVRLFLLKIFSSETAIEFCPHSTGMISGWPLLPHFFRWWGGGQNWSSKMPILKFMFETTRSRALRIWYTCTCTCI